MNKQWHVIGQQIALDNKTRRKIFKNICLIDTLPKFVPRWPRLSKIELLFNFSFKKYILPF